MRCSEPAWAPRCPWHPWPDAIKPHHLTALSGDSRSTAHRFVIRLYHQNIARGILKEPEVYFYDTGLVLGDQGARFENATATMLLTHIRFQQDAHGKTIGLHFIRNKQHEEIDFVLIENHEITHLIEAKHQDACCWSDI